MKDHSEEYILRTQGNVTVVRLRAENLMGTLDVSYLQEQLLGLIEGGHHRMVLDLKYVRHMGSAALGMLIAMNQLMKTKGGRLILSHTEFIEPVLAASHTRKLFTIVADPREGVEAMKDKDEG